MFLGLVISVIPRKSVIFGGKIVGVAGLQPNTFSHRPVIVGRGYFPFHILNW